MANEFDKVLEKTENIKEDARADLMRKLDRILGGCGFGTIPIAERLAEIAEEEDAGEKLMKHDKIKAVKLLTDLRFAKQQDVKLEGEIKTQGLSQKELDEIMDE